MQTQEELLIKTPKILVQLFESSAGAVEVNDMLTEVFCAYVEHRVKGTGVVNRDIDIDTITDFRRNIMHLFTDHLSGKFQDSGFVPKEFPLGVYADLYLRGPETITEMLLIVEDMFDAYLRSDYFQGPSDEFLTLFCNLRKALVELIGNVYAEIFRSESLHKKILQEELTLLRDTQLAALTANCN